MLCEVLRPISGPDGAQIAAGQVLDVSGWRQLNVKGLINQRFLREVHMPAALPLSDVPHEAARDDSGKRYRTNRM